MAQPSWIGQILGGRYQIEDLVGQGGMSAVYRANDPNLRRPVAVKLIHPHLSTDDDFVRRFREEAAAVARLRHPNIIQVYDFNNDNNTYYIVFEFIPGESLQARLKRMYNANRKLEVSETIATITALAEAIDYAHKQGLVHRDIKPANVMINVHNQPILMDFGIVKIVGGTQHTATGATLGTARYMAPEQIRGEQVDGRTDIYSLGATLFEMLGGRAPFEADSAMTVMMMHINDPVPDLAQLRPDITPALVAVVNKCLAKNPAARFQTAGDMANALRQALRTPAGSIITAPVSPVESTVVEPPPPSTTIPLKPPKSISPPKTVEPAPPKSDSNRSSTLIVTAIALGVLSLACLVISAIIFVPRLLNPSPTEPAVAALTQTPSPTNSPIPVENQLPTPAQPTNTANSPATVAATPTTRPSATPPPPASQTPTFTPTAGPTNTATVPVLPYARINNITIGEGNRYVVDYESFGFTETLPGQHVHFFFNTVSPENAGVPGTGPWVLYGGPRPFLGYKVNERPNGATQMCILVANSDHSVQLNSGNCFDLP